MMTIEEINAELNTYSATPDAGIQKILISNLSERIKREKLPFQIVNNGGKFELVEVGESTEAFLSRFITFNSQMLLLKSQVRKLAKVDCFEDKDIFSVLISGPTGTGKELLARALHGESTGRFVAVNCAGLPSELIESLLFGHVRGSFTGATETREGLMKLAKNGTFFLDEIGEFPLQSQGKLLRALQEKKITKIGSDKEESINCRVVCATNKNIAEMVSKGMFRIDLYARISTFELDTIGLEHRPEDIEPILKSLPDGVKFLEAFNKAAETFRPLCTVPIHFNVRSLQQHVKRYSVLGILPL